MKMKDKSIDLMPEEPDQFQILKETYSEVNLESILKESIKDKTLAFFEAMKYFVAHREPMPHHWLEVSTNLLINTAKARVDKTRNILADQLAIKNNPSLTRDKAYNRIVHYYMLEGGGRSQNEAIDLTIAC